MKLEAIGIGAPDNTPVRTERFENFTIESNDIEMVRGGRSGVYVGKQNAGYLTVGGWMSSNSGVGLAQGARLAMVEGGPAARMGAITLINGQAIVRTTSVRANSRIFLTQQQDGGVPGTVRVSSRTPGIFFVIRSSSSNDKSVVGWVMVDPSY